MQQYIQCLRGYVLATRPPSTAAAKTLPGCLHTEPLLLSLLRGLGLLQIHPSLDPPFPPQGPL
eukprot:1159978-Pelagomonas_calceolata.AAC.1